jgi:hypothetical protein
MFIDGHTPGPATVAVAVVAIAALYRAAVTNSPPLATALAAALPIAGLGAGHSTYDRRIVVPVAAVFAAAVDRRGAVRALPVVFAIAGAVVSAAGAACDAPALVAIDGVWAAAALGAVFLPGASRPSAVVMLSLLECAATVMIVAADPADFGDRERHLTWWGLALLALFDWERSWGRADRIVVVVWLLQIVIIAGVWAMSIGRCSLLVDTFDVVGATPYFIGNFVMHYWPAIRILHYRPKLPIPDVWGQTISAIGVVALYTATVDPAIVYGCGAWTVWPVPGAAFAVLIVAGGAVASARWGPGV